MELLDKPGLPVLPLVALVVKQKMGTAAENTRSCRPLEKIIWNAPILNLNKIELENSKIVDNLMTLSTAIV